ncbi:hypothetical protein EUX98_g768 [Antrodiella citrinella]|uniref:Uncharacterized protein n=1 Tax=Antrodiella citrinella TaxID=2447956 RepID=A0A4V6S1Y8_9APHY|nr:hypothetical protein EUX98_g768 [Antrodiella citrinella]
MRITHHEVSPNLTSVQFGFALPPSPSTYNAPSISAPFPPSEDNSPLMMLRFRRPSLLAPLRPGTVQDGRLHSPLATTPLTVPLSRRYSTSIKDDTGDESESDKDKMWTDSPPSVDSGATTPSLGSDPSLLKADSDVSIKSTTPARSSSPLPQTPAKPPVDLGSESTAQMQLRRLSQPIKMPRILTLVSESHPEEAEVKSEAQFQRFVASCSDLPLQPRTLRAPSDRGRYPEEADTDEPVREDTPSDDDDDNADVAESSTFTFGAHSEPINIIKPVTPAQSVNGDDFSVESPGAAMDVDMPFYGGSPAPSMASWRYTPPPTSSAVRSSKRKFDDRYDPYPASKRRAVSPSVSLLRESQSSFFPRTPNSSRVPMPIPIAIPSGISSGSSSPVVSSFGGGSLAGGRPMSIGSSSALSSPTLRAQIGLSSPILRPMKRARRDTDAAARREVEGAGEGVNELSLE